MSRLWGLLFYFLFSLPHVGPSVLTMIVNRFHMFFNELPNNTSQQLPLIIVGFGFTPAQSALFNIAKPLWGSFLLLVSAAMLYATNLGVGYTCAISYIPCFVGGIMEVRTITNRLTLKNN
jgi:hypothetical protein